ncbi:SusD/RagB family nutrient-binding outer membrane lipoprotein [uncultured Flavobacterium sp.]|uniref:SusD/RagB family nutrient-binding outer membrane lipoprotein n=1 Tax=uncultured Flavobacterium sp. TaxID=165435 RepID=UPI003081B6A4
MKKIFLSIVTLTFLTLTSCVSDNENFNDDIKKSYDVSAESLLSDAQKELTDQLTTPSVNNNPLRYYVQYWAATLYTAESRYNLTTRTIPDTHWTNLYQNVLGNLQTSEQVLLKQTKPGAVAEADWQKQQQNKVAILEILRVYTYQILVDTFGDVPYSESLQNPKIILPKYDNDSEIYPLLIARLDAAIAKLDTSAKSFDTGDLIYKGDVANWKLFANSVKLKLGTNLSDINPTLAKTTVESAYTAGLLVKNINNALLKYASFAPNYNPVFDNLVASQRNDNVPASPLVNKMNATSDPRRAIFFTPMADGTYKGGVPGGRNSLPYETTYSHVGDVIKKPDAPGVLLEAFEVNFYLAEAAARGYSVGGTPESYYKEAITLSCEYWGVSSTDIATYLANPEVAYATAATTPITGVPGTGTGTWQEKIGYQEWIALYNRSFQSWTAFRRLDFPVLISHPSSISAANKQVPVRWTYPTAEQTVNGTNWTAASAAIGGDKLTTKIFWDTKQPPL